MVVQYKWKSPASDDYLIEGFFIEGRRTSSSRQRSTSYGTTDVSKEGWKLLHHPPYSPNLANSNFYVFKPMKGTLWGMKFISNEQVKKKDQNWLREQGNEFFAEEIRSLLRRWDKCVEVGWGLYRKIDKKLYWLCKLFLMYSYISVLFLKDPRTCF